MSDPDPTRDIRLLTWNVDGLNESQLGQRMEELCLEILIGGDLSRAAAGRPTRPMPHVVALQEVVRVAHHGFFTPHFSAAGFTLWPPRDPGGCGHYELLAVRAPWALGDCERHPFEETPLGRARTTAILRHTGTGERVALATAHLESLRSGEPARIAQALEISAWMCSQIPEGTPAIFAGDTNLRDAEWSVVEGELAERGVRDAFLELGSPPAARATWRPESDPRRGFRFDRVWLRGAITPRELSLRDLPRASDHAGVETVLRLG
jgi:endonuclease/exonuclease/phosphatase (EEP) superfamily protein YafD